MSEIINSMPQNIVLIYKIKQKLHQSLKQLKFDKWSINVYFKWASTIFCI